MDNQILIITDAGLKIKLWKDNFVLQLPSHRKQGPRITTAHHQKSLQKL